MDSGKRAIGVARAVFGLVLLAFVVSRVDPRGVLQILSRISWSALGLALLAQAAAKIVWTVRWREILRANGLERGFWELVAAVLVGLFYNSFLPTAVGGDVVRGYYAARGRERLAASYATVFVERAIGLICLAAMAAIAATAALVTGALPQMRNALGWVAVIGFGATVVGMGAFGWRGWRSILPGLNQAGGRAVRFAACLVSAMDLFRQKATRRWWIVGTSFALQVIAVFFHVACARAVGLDTPALTFFLIVPASVLVAMVPVTLNGLGLREGALVGLLISIGEPAGKAGAFAMLALLSASVFALAGGGINLFYRPGRSEVADAAPADA